MASRIYAEGAPVVLADSVTVLPADVAGAVLVTGSHGGLYPAALAAIARVGALVFHDAGGGLEAAGLAALSVFEEHGRPAVATGHETAQVGSAGDMIERGRVSGANGPARSCGIEIGMPVREAVRRLVERGFAPIGRPPGKPAESRTVDDRPGARRVVLVDSAALVEPGDAGAIVVTGSHGGLVGGDPAKALKVDAFAAAFNDAGIGIEDAGIGRLAALDARAIAAVTVAAATARIGEARSTLADGVVSRANRTALLRGAAPGMRLAHLVETWRTLPD